MKRKARVQVPENGVKADTTADTAQIHTNDSGCIVEVSDLAVMMHSLHTVKVRGCDWFERLEFFPYIKERRLQAD